jgi:FdhD protein
MIGSRGGSRTYRVTKYRDGQGSRERDALAVEEPMEIRLAWVDGGHKRVEALAVTMRTPGHDFELVAGFLHGEGVISAAEDLVELTYCTGPEEQEYNVVEARLAPGRSFDPESVRRNFYTTSSCGVCGKASLEAVEAQGCAILPAGASVTAEQVVALPDRLREAQGVFSRTGGLHAAGLFHADGRRQVALEDVGRHNAVDKVVGHALLGRTLPAHDRILVVSGRASFEVIQKAIAAGIPILVAVGAPSSLAVDLAQRFGQTLIGFARDGGFNVYSAPERVV